MEVNKNMNHDSVIKDLLQRVENLENIVLNKSANEISEVSSPVGKQKLKELVGKMQSELSELKLHYEQNDTIIFQAILNPKDFTDQYQVTSLYTLTDEEQDSELAAICNVLSSKQRLSIIKILARQSLSSGELVTMTQMAGGHLHHHLKDLQSKGFIIKNDNGKYETTNFGLSAYLAVASLNRKRRYNE